MARSHGTRSGGVSKRQRSSGGISTAKVRKIVKEVNAKSREKKHVNIQQLDFPISTTGVNFTIDPSPIAQGTGANQRVGNNVQWKSWYMKMIVKAGVNTASTHIVRLIWYTPRDQGDTIPTTTSVTGFLDSGQSNFPLSYDFY